MYRTQRRFLGLEILLRTVLALHIDYDQSERERERHLDYISEDAKKSGAFSYSQRPDTYNGKINWNWYNCE